MSTLDFPGSHKLIDALDRAVGAGDERAITTALRTTLCRLIRDTEVQLPACVFEPVTDHYARRELHLSERHGYNVVAMTWGPGQGTSIHDHNGLWCVEGVWDGQLEIVQYELIDTVDDRYHFIPAATLQAGTGSAGSLIPPHEYHTIRNPSDDALTVSVHIYKQRMTRCSIFEPVGEDWFTRNERKLVLDDAG